jgi:hypothetical protein
MSRCGLQKCWPSSARSSKAVLPAEVSSMGNPNGWPSIPLNGTLRPGFWQAFTQLAREVLGRVQGGQPG